MANDILIDMLASLSLESGSATSFAEPKTTILSDSTKNWPADKFKHCIVRIVYGTGTGQLARIIANSADSLQASPPWVKGLDTTSVYVIYQPEVSDQVDRILAGVDTLQARLTAARAALLNNLSEVTAARMEQLDPANLPADITTILAIVGGIAGGANWNPYGPRNVEVDNDVTAGVTVYDPGGGIVPAADITGGTYTIERIRGAAAAGIVGPAASSVADGLVFAGYDFPGADWDVGDIFIFTFEGIAIDIGGTITNLPPVQMYGRVVREADIQSTVTTIDTNIGAMEGGIDLHNKLTAARAILLDNLDAAISTRALEDGGKLQDTEGAVGAMADAATLDDLSDVTTTSAHAKLRRILLRISAAALSVTIDPGGAARTDLATLWNDLGQMLAGAAGITTWPARAKAADTVSLAEAVRDIDELKPEWAARTSATHTTTGVTEETILTTAYTVPGLFHFNLTLRNMVALDDFTIRVYKRVDGANYDLKSEQQFVGVPTLKIYEIEGIYTDGTEFIRITIQRASATNQAFPYSYNFLRQPVA